MGAKRQLEQERPCPVVIRVRDVVTTFLSFLPFALAAAISPMMLAEQTLLLSQPNGRATGRRFALGVAFVLLVVVALLIGFGRAISLPKEPKLSSGLDILIGAGLLLIALVLWQRKRHGVKAPEEKGALSRFGASGAYAFGMFSMATNFTSLALIVPAAKEISASDTSFPERELLALILTFIVATPVWLPLALTAIAPGPAERVLDAIDQFIKTRGRQATLVLLFGLGLFLVLRGLIHLL